MVYIKKLVMHGFKSFANRTEIVFDKGINVIIGPNGSGKSNISDALCFVLGRLSTKSIRAAKAKNLLFMGSKYAKPARDAEVELVFDNTDRSFALDTPEVTISRVVRHNGMSVYRINGETKTRAEVIEMLAQGGIDPHGFNLILQGQIQAVVKMHPEERRKIIEEVAGIAVYESRKEKSLHELEKTEERLKEITSILRERTAYLRNLEEERSQALKYKELELTIRRCKASIIQKKLDDKQKELAGITKSIEEKMKAKDKIKAKAEECQQSIDKLNENITQINKHIQRTTGVEQEKLREQITTLRAEREGLRVRMESIEHRKSETQRRIEELKKSVPDYEREIHELRQESPMLAKKQEELRKKKDELKEIEEDKKKVYALKTELQGIKDRLKDKEMQLHRIAGESDALVKQLEEYAMTAVHKDAESCRKALEECRAESQAAMDSLNKLTQSELAHTAEISSAETEMRAAEKIKLQIQKIDVCPLCQSTMTAAHVGHVTSEADSRIAAAQQLLTDAKNGLASVHTQREMLTKAWRELKKKESDLERELALQQRSQDRQEYLKRLVVQEKQLRIERDELERRRVALQDKTIDASALDERYAQKMMEIEEISSRTEKDVDSALLFKERELERVHENVKIAARNLAEYTKDAEDLSDTFGMKSELLEKKEVEERELSERFKKFFKERDEAQEMVQKQSYDLSTFQNEQRQVEDQMNYLRVGSAQMDAQREALEMELKDYGTVELIAGSLAALEERLQKAQITIQTIGPINMRALETYDEIKKEYERVQEKVTTLEKEKQEIMGIIQEIDHKKKRSFMKTLTQVNELFSSNFARLSSKGQAFLEIENAEDIFAGGLNIVIRLAKGKYFDVTSLSGGEQTLVALSLLFAIQEYKPYHFYVFDEIDAALDKRNAERLSALLSQYMKSGQYITVTHNDALIMNSNVLYGVSMHEGISKVLSIKLPPEMPRPVQQDTPQPKQEPVAEAPAQESDDSAEENEEDNDTEEAEAEE